MNLTYSSTDDIYHVGFAQGPSCERDIQYVQQLQTNVVRSYRDDYANNHDACTKEFAGVGIYAFIDLAAPGLMIGNATPVWNDALFDRYTDAIYPIHNYMNDPGSIVGDHVTQVVA